MKMKSLPSALRIVGGALAALFCVVSVAPASAAPAADNARSSAATTWVATWATAPFGGDPWHTVPTLVGSTLREIVHTSIPGKQLRVQFTNEFGKEPLKIDAATVAMSAGGPAIDTASLHTLTFGGSPSIVVPPGALAVSDPVDLATPAFANLAITFYLPLQQISDVSVHSGADEANYIQPGNEVSAQALTEAKITPSWYFVKGVDVVPTEKGAAAVVAFGDSITDGAYARENMNETWPEDLAKRLHDDPKTADLSVLNEGIGGNCVLIHCVGPNALARFDRDVLAQTGVKYVIILESINDIGAMHNPNQPDYKLTAEDLEQGLRQLIARAHEHGIKVFGATLTPYQGAGYYTDQGEKVREAVNEWIRTGGAFDGVVDFDKATRDPAKPLWYAPQYDSGDHLHPKGTGYAAMAGAIDLGLFK